MWPEFVETVGNRFNHSDYLVWSRIAGVLWTVADAIIAFCMIYIGNLVRAYQAVRPHRFSYALLATSCLPAVYIPFVDTSAAFYRLELIITIPQYLIILYICAADARLAIHALANAARPHTS